MSLFAQIVRTTVNAVLVPVALVQDIVMAPLDSVLATDKRVGERTADRIQQLKDEAKEQP